MLNDAWQIHLQSSQRAACPFRRRVLLALVGSLFTIFAALAADSPATQALSQDTVPARTDRYGDPLPPGALARFGTLRWRHPGLIRSVAFSPDGRLLASAGSDGVICLWDRKTGKVIRRVAADDADRIVFSSDAALLVTASASEKIRVWDIRSGKEVFKVGGHEGGGWVHCHAVALSPDSKQLMYAGPDGFAHTWELSTGKKLIRFKLQKGDAMYSMAFSKDGKRLASAIRWLKDPSSGTGPVCVWDTSTGKELFRLSGHTQPVESLTFSPDGTILASSADTGVVLWDMATGKELRTLEKEPERCRAIAFSPDGKTIATGGNWGKLRLWETATGKQIKTFTSELTSLWELAFAPDGSTLAAVGAGNAVHLVDALTGKGINEDSEPDDEIHSMSFLPDGRKLGLGTANVVWQWEPSTGTRFEKLWTNENHPKGGWRSFFAVSPNGKYFGLGGSYVTIYDFATGKPLHTLEGTIEHIRSFIFSPDSAIVAAVLSSGAAFWNARDGKFLRFHKGTGMTSQLAFAPDGQTFATTWHPELFPFAKAGIEVWDQKSRKRINELVVSKAWFRKLAYSPDSKSIVALFQDLQNGDCKLIIWDLATGTKREIPREPDAATVAFTTGTGRPLKRMPEASALAFSPDGKLLALEGRNHAVCLVDVTTRKELKALMGHQAGIRCLAFSPDGKLLVSGSEDATALVWDIGELLQGSRR